MTERYTPNGIPLTDYERELLVILMEECAEVTQAASKLIRFGKENRPGADQSNSVHLGLEVGDALRVLQMAQDCGLISHVDIEAGGRRKKDRLAKYMQSTR